MCFSCWNFIQVSYVIFTGTIISGCLCLCFGHPRFSQSDNWRGRIGTFIINIIVGISQAFTIIFCLVGWGWSIWWGMMMVEFASECYVRFLIFLSLWQFFFSQRKTQEINAGCSSGRKCGRRNDFKQSNGCSTTSCCSKSWRAIKKYCEIVLKGIQILFFSFFYLLIFYTIAFRTFSKFFYI